MTASCCCSAPWPSKRSYSAGHISKELLEYGFARAAQLGFRAVLVEGNPANYRARGFVTAAPYGILPGKTVHLPHIDCLMVKELQPGRPGPHPRRPGISLPSAAIGPAPRKENPPEWTVT